MVSFKDRLYVFGQKRRFHGKGEPNLSKIAKYSRNLNDWDIRKGKIRLGLLTGLNLSSLPKKTPLNPVIHTLREYHGYKAENVYFESVPGFYVTGTLYRPAQSNTPTPIILKPHGHMKNKRYKVDNQNFCATFARMGATVFTYDMVGYACSTQVEHKIKSTSTLQTWNSIRALDLVLSLPNVDKSKVGVSGGSGGGTQTFLLTAIDDRITVSAPMVMVSSFFFGGCICESGLPIHKGDGYATNNAEIAAIAAPRPQIIVSDSGDWTRMVPEWEFPFIQNIYKLYNAEDLVENAHIEGEGHDIRPSKRQPVYRFFAKHFDLDLSHMMDESGFVDESKNIIEDTPKLLVFSETHPRPDNALPSERTILEVLQNLQ